MARAALAFALLAALASPALAADGVKPSIVNARRARAKARLVRAAGGAGALQAPGYIGAKGKYVAPTCAALFQLSLDSADPASPVSANAAITVTLPCAAGSNSLGSWDAPDYNCYAPSMPEAKDAFGNLGAYFAFGSKTRITIQGDPDTCVKAGLRPTLYGSVPDFNESTVVPFLGFESMPPASGSALVVTATVKDIIIDGGGRRPGITANLVSLLTLSNVDVINAADYYGGAAVSTYDTKAVIKGNPSKPARITGALTRGLTRKQDLSFPGAGGALYHSPQQERGRDLLVQDVVVRGNAHTAYGGAYYVYKVAQPMMKVTFKNVDFGGNSAPLCSTGLTYRQDTDPSDPPLPGDKILLGFSGTTGFDANTGTGALCGVYSTAALPPTGTMGWDPKRATAVSPNPPPGLSAVTTLPVSVSLPDGTQLEYAYA